MSTFAATQAQISLPQAVSQPSKSASDAQVVPSTPTISQPQVNPIQSQPQSQPVPQGTFGSFSGTGPTIIPYQTNTIMLNDYGIGYARIEDGIYAASDSGVQGSVVNAGNYDFFTPQQLYNSMDSIRNQLYYNQNPYFPRSASIVDAPARLKEKLLQKIDSSSLEEQLKEQIKRRLGDKIDSAVGTGQTIVSGVEDIAGIVLAATSGGSTAGIESLFDSIMNGDFLDNSSFEALASSGEDMLSSILNLFEGDGSFFERINDVKDNFGKVSSNFTSIKDMVENTINLPKKALRGASDIISGAANYADMAYRDIPVFHDAVNWLDQTTGLVSNFEVGTTETLNFLNDLVDANWENILNPFQNPFQP